MGLQCNRDEQKSGSAVRGRTRDEGEHGGAGSNGVKPQTSVSGAWSPHVLCSFGLAGGAESTRDHNRGPDPSLGQARVLLTLGQSGARALPTRLCFALRAALGIAGH